MRVGHARPMSFEALVARQAGVITLAQAVSCGMSAATVHRRARDRVWSRLHPGAYLVGGHRLGDEARVRAAALGAGDGSTVTGPAAAHWHRMRDRAPDVIDITVPLSAKPRPQPGTCLRRREPAWQDVLDIRGVHLTQKPLTASETALTLPDGSMFLDRATRWPAGRDGDRDRRDPGPRSCDRQNRDMSCTHAARVPIPVIFSAPVEVPQQGDPRVVVDGLAVDVQHQGSAWRRTRPTAGCGARRRRPPGRPGTSPVPSRALRSGGPRHP